MNALCRLTVCVLFLLTSFWASTVSSAQTTQKALSSPELSAPTAAVVAVPSIKFDVVSFKPCEKIDLSRKNTILGGDSIARHCQPMLALFDYSYNFVGPYLVKGEPEWVDTEPWEFQAKVAPEDVAAWQQTDRTTKGLMVRAVLADVLHLKVHIETQSIPVYNLVVAKGGPKLTDAPVDPAKTEMGTLSTVGVDEVIFRNATMSLLANVLAARLDRNVIDKTGLTGHYTFHVKPLPFAHYDPKSSSVETTDFAAIIEGVKDLGLRLEPGKADTSVIIVDHIDRPPDQ